jgi:hypothetical protein
VQVGQHVTGRVVCHENHALRAEIYGRAHEHTQVVNRRLAYRVIRVDQVRAAGVERRDTHAGGLRSFGDALYTGLQHDIPGEFNADTETRRVMKLFLD